jgi:hypothetical protein
LLGKFFGIATSKREREWVWEEERERGEGCGRKKGISFEWVLSHGGNNANDSCRYEIASD